MTRPPSYPVIVVHLDDGTGRTICSDERMSLPTPPQYDNVPRYFCIACQLDAQR